MHEQPTCQLIPTRNDRFSKAYATPQGENRRCGAFQPVWLVDFSHLEHRFWSPAPWAPALWMSHLFRTHHLVELLSGKIAQLKRRLAQTQIFVMSFMGNGGGFVISDFGAQGGHQHQGVIDMFPH